jgi:hypothetical protein
MSFNQQVPVPKLGSGNNSEEALIIKKSAKVNRTKTPEGLKRSQSTAGLNITDSIAALRIPKRTIPTIIATNRSKPSQVGRVSQANIYNSASNLNDSTKLPLLNKSRKRGSIYQNALEGEMVHKDPISNLKKHMFQATTQHSRNNSHPAGLLSLPLPQFGSGMAPIDHYNMRTGPSEYYNGSLTSGRMLPPPGFFEGGSFDFANQSQPLVVIDSRRGHGSDSEERRKHKRKKRIQRLKALRADATSGQYDTQAHLNDPMLQYMMQSQNMQQFHTNTTNMMMMAMMLAKKDEVKTIQPFP